jgi:hypothetical protein
MDGATPFPLGLLLFKADASSDSETRRREGGVGEETAAE